jgi:MFS family permease
VQSTGRADAAGKILLISTAASLVLSPILGATVDYFARKKAMLLCGHLGIVVSGGIPLLAQATLTDETMFEAIAVAVVVATVSSSVLGGAMDYFLKTHLQQSERSRHLATLNSIAQIALIFGTALGGLVVAQGNHVHAFLFSSFCGALLAGISWCLLPVLNVARNNASPTWKRGAFAAGTDALPSAPPTIRDSSLRRIGVCDRADHEHIATGAYPLPFPRHERGLFDDRSSVVDRRTSSRRVAGKVCGEFAGYHERRFHRGWSDGYHSRGNSASVCFSGSTVNAFTSRRWLRPGTHTKRDSIPG